MIFNEKVVLLDVEAETSEDVIRAGAQALLERGIVKDTYCENVLKREKTYPTGLETGGINVAIPHTETIHVNRSQVAFIRLKKPVIFHALDDETADVPVQMAFMIAMKEPHEQGDTLTSLMGLFGQQDLLEDLMKCQSADEFAELVKARGVE